jgi:hypothetical protein
VEFLGGVFGVLFIMLKCPFCHVKFTMMRSPPMSLAGDATLLANSYHLCIPTLSFGKLFNNCLTSSNK